MDPYGLGIQWDPASGQPPPNPAFGGQSVYVPAAGPPSQPGFNPGLPTANLPVAGNQGGIGAFNGGQPPPGFDPNAFNQEPLGGKIPPELLLWMIMGGSGSINNALQSQDPGAANVFPGQFPGGLPGLGGMSGGPGAGPGTGIPGLNPNWNPANDPYSL